MSPEERRRRVLEMGGPAYLAAALVVSGLGGDRNPYGRRRTPPPPPPPLTEINDDFSDGVLGDYWEDPDTPTSLASWGEAGSRLTGPTSGFLDAGENVHRQLIVKTLGTFADGEIWAASTGATTSGAVLARWDPATDTGVAVVRTSTFNAQIRHVVNEATNSVLGNIAIMGADTFGLRWTGSVLQPMKNGATYGAPIAWALPAGAGYWGVGANIANARWANLHVKKF